MNHDEKAKAAVQRQARVLRILSCLQSGSHFNAKELARRLRVSRRTVYRDLKMMREAGVPIHFDGEHSAYRVSASYPNDVAPPKLSLHDLTMLLVAVNFSALQTLPEVQLAVRESAARLMGCYRETLRPRIARVLGACELALETPSIPPRGQDAVMEILEAVSHRRRIHLRLMGETEWINFAVYRFFLTAQGWYIYGHRQDSNAVQTISILSIEDAKVGDAAFTIPPGLRTRLHSPGVVAELLEREIVEEAA